MKHFLPVLILVTGFAATSRADFESAPPSRLHDAMQLQPDDETGIETDANSAASPYPHGVPRKNNRELNQSISTAVLDAVVQALENDPDLGATDGEDITAELQTGRQKGGWSDWRDRSMDRLNPGGGETPIATLAILLIFATLITLVATVLYTGHRKRRLARDLMNENRIP